MQTVVAMDMSQQEESMPCHEEQAPSSKGCVTHCSQADQISLDHAAAIAAPVSAASWVVATTAPVQHVQQAITSQHVALNTGPPLPIRFCSFLI
jgi:hypothetical protein